MTYEEVIKVIKNEKECVLRNIGGCDRDCKKCDLVMKDEDIISAYDVAISVLEKQIPKKPSIEQNGYDDGCLTYTTWYCPRCDEMYEIDYYDDYKHCPECGRTIYWSDENDGQRDC